MLDFLLPAALALPAPVAAPSVTDAAFAFAQIKGLVGTWRNAERPQRSRPASRG